MSTLIENVNDIVLIKEDLDALLNEYGVDGGEQFDTYPEKFRELFRLIQDSTVIAVDTLYQDVDTVTIVADPVIWQSDNIIQITCATVDAVIYYRMVGLDTGTDWGETEYKNKFYISENAHIEAYAMDKNKQYRSGTVWINAEYVLGDVPEKPVINRDRTTGDVTMTCATEGASIYFRNGGSDWTLYTGEVYIPLADDIYAYSVKDGVASEIVFDEGLDDTVRPAIPVISYSNNTITITDSTEGANIYYRERLSDTWILYEGPVEISESGWYVSIAYKDGIYSEQTDPPLFCEYVSPIPAEPEISCENNTVTITCDTLGATIYFKDEDSDIWLIYSGPFTISETVTIESKSFKNGYYSDVVSVECEYDDSGSGGGGDTPSYQKPEKPEMSLYYNTVTITCATEGATIYWMYLLDNEWIEYEGPFQISKTGYYVSKAVKNDIESDLSDVAYFEYDSGIDYIVPAIPSIDCYANEVSISCSTEDADIYYRIGTSGSFSLYTTPFSISGTVTVYSYSTLNGVDSDTTSKECTYYETPTAPVITCEDNIVNITSVDGGKIFYKKSADSDWTEYAGMFMIFESAYYNARVFKNGLYSNITTTLCNYSSDAEADYEEWLSYKTVPFNFEALEDGDLIITAKASFYYKKNGDISTREYEGRNVIDTTDWRYVHVSGWVTVTFHVLDGDIIYILGEHSNINDYDNDKLSTGVRFNISGNIASLAYGLEFINHIDEEITSGDLIKTPASKLISAKNLVLSSVGYPRITFAGSTELVEGPYVLPATELKADCYHYLFSGCSSLQTIPKINATTLSTGCYYGMFRNCTSLTSIPTGLLPITTIPYKECYKYMFQGCTGLTSLPAGLLPATTLAEKCYQYMFEGCTGLTSLPAGLLPATTLKPYCYYKMFYNCSSLETIPTNLLPATTIAHSCYNGMFENCSALTNTVDILPATTLANYCYYRMFYNCTLITTAPELPARNFKEGCYVNMFGMCRSLNYIKCLAVPPGANYMDNYTLGWVVRVASSGTFIKKSGANYWPTGTNGIPSGWTVQQV